MRPKGADDSIRCGASQEAETVPRSSTGVEWNTVIMFRLPEKPALLRTESASLAQWHLQVKSTYRRNIGIKTKARPASQRFAYLENCGIKTIT
jgi:hypothetical protein